MAVFNPTHLHCLPLYQHLKQVANRTTYLQRDRESRAQKSVEPQRGSGAERWSGGQGGGAKSPEPESLLAAACTPTKERQNLHVMNI